MARSLSYSDAVKLLGKQNNKTVHVLDQLTGGLLLAASATGAGFALSLFDPAARLARLSGELISTLNVRLSGTGRCDRSEQLAAAHAIIVLTAYFEATSKARLPFDVEKLKLTRSKQVAITTGKATESRRIADLGISLLRANVPTHAPQLPYEMTLMEFRGFYLALSDKLYEFISGLAVWNHLDETQRRRLRNVLEDEVPSRAVRLSQQER